MAWYYVTRLPWHDEKAIPSVEIMSAHIHANTIRDTKSGQLIYGWIETTEPLNEQMIKEYGLIEGETKQ